MHYCSIHLSNAVCRNGLRMVFFFFPGGVSPVVLVVAKGEGKGGGSSLVKGREGERESERESSMIMNEIIGPFL